MAVAFHRVLVGLAAIAITSAPALAAQSAAEACLTNEAPQAVRKSAMDASADMLSGKPGASEALRTALDQIAAPCAKKFGWNADVRKTAHAVLWFTALHATLSGALRDAGVDVDRLIRFGEALPDADRKPFFDPAAALTQPFRARIIAKLEQAGLKAPTAQISMAQVDLLYLTGSRNTAQADFDRLVSGPAPASSARPLEDPRKCLLDEAPLADLARFMAELDAKVAGRSVSWASTEEGFKAASATRCVAKKGWNPAFTRAANNLIYAEGYARTWGAHLQKQGFNPAQLDTHIDRQNFKQLVDLQRVAANNLTTTPEWQHLTLLFGRSVQNDAQKKALLQYVYFRTQVQKLWFTYGRLNSPEAAHMLTMPWQVLPSIEASRPVIRERTLSKEEKSEVSRLSKLYFTPSNKGGNTLAQLQRLSELGQSGDRQAMIAARDALGKGPPWELTSYYLDLNIDHDILRDMTSRLAAIWTAMLWQRFGYDDSGRKYMKACVGGLFGEVYHDKNNGVAAMLGADGVVRAVNDNGIIMDETVDGCGFTLLGSAAGSPGAKGGKVLKFYEKRNSFGALGNRYETRDYVITGVRFEPIIGDAASQQAKFERHLDLRRRGVLFDSRDGRRVSLTPTLAVTLPWYERYALETGQINLLQQADANSNQAIAAQLKRDASARVARWERALSAFKGNSLDESKRYELMYAASDLGGSYWAEYKRLVPDQPAMAYGGGSVGIGSGRSSAGGQVEVRTYDRNGTYTGSTKTSAVWADIMKMTSGPAN